jgi:hypothetical protein
MITTTNTGTPYQYLGTHPDVSTSAQPSNDSTTEQNDMTPAQRYASVHARSRTSLMSGTSIGDRDPSDLDAARNMFPPEIPLFGHYSRGQEPVESPDERRSPEDRVTNGDNRVSEISQPDTLDSCTPLKPIPAADPSPASSNPYGSSSEQASDAARASQAADTPPPPQPPATTEWLYDRPLPPWYPGLAYCRYCKIYKPERTHHCRHCGTCVLAME